MCVSVHEEYVEVCDPLIPVRCQCHQHSMHGFHIPLTLYPFLLLLSQSAIVKIFFLILHMFPFLERGLIRVRMGIMIVKPLLTFDPTTLS